jgi:hypothetical protein
LVSSAPLRADSICEIGLSFLFCNLLSQLVL